MAVMTLVVGRVVLARHQFDLWSPPVPAWAVTVVVPAPIDDAVPALIDDAVTAVQAPIDDAETVVPAPIDVDRIAARSGMAGIGIGTTPGVDDVFHCS